MLFKTDADKKLGDIVFYKESEQRQYIPAMIVAIYPLAEVDGKKETRNAVALVGLVDGLHGSTFSRGRAKYGEKVGDFVNTIEEAEEALVREKREAEAKYKKLLDNVTAKTEPIDLAEPKDKKEKSAK
jgi:hypothetical protein